MNNSIPQRKPLLSLPMTSDLCPDLKKTYKFFESFESNFITAQVISPAITWITLAPTLSLPKKLFFLQPNQNGKRCYWTRLHHLPPWRRYRTGLHHFPRCCYRPRMHHLLSSLAILPTTIPTHDEGTMGKRGEEWLALSPFFSTCQPRRFVTLRHQIRPRKSASKWTKIFDMARWTTDGRRKVY